MRCVNTKDRRPTRRGALDYLNDWSAPDKGWLRKFYTPDTDEAQFDLTPATEKAILWLLSLTERSFVGTESRLLTLLALLEQMSTGTETDPKKRVEELQKKRDALDIEIAHVLEGHTPLLDDTAIKDRFQQFQQLARELLSDFRQVQDNFRQLDRKVREKIALWEGTKGTLLDEIMGERDAIGDSDQGRSFRAFWNFLLSSRRREELSGGSGPDAGAARGGGAASGAAYPSHPRRLDRSRRTNPAYHQPTIAAITPLCGKPSFSGEPPHYGPATRHWAQRTRPARHDTLRHSDAPGCDRGGHSTAAGTPLIHPTRKAAPG